jgi:hypothetical protein
VDAEFAKANALHFAIGRVIFDPVLVAAKAIAMVQDRRALVGLHRQFIEPPAGKFTESLEMRREVLERFLIEIEREKIARCPIDGPEVEPVTIWSDQVGAGRRDVGDGGRREIAQSGHGSTPLHGAG